MDIYGLSEKSKKLLMQEMKLRGYSNRTIKDYIYFNDKFIKWAKKSPLKISSKNIKYYLLEMIDKGMNENSTNKIHASLKFYYSQILKRKFFDSIPRRKIPKKVVEVLSKDEILRMIKSTNNLKHRILIELLYSSGLRIGEAVCVKIENFDCENKTLLIKKGKGKKDRYVILSDKFIDDFKRYIDIENIYFGYLFFGRKGHITIETGRAIIKTAAKRARINKNVFPHKLRSSFATHLFDKGIDSIHIKRLLGHSRIETTLQYISSKPNFGIKSPLDY
ncbi:tyrosine-type recombinase/integrase [archaeon]|jgi:integrase/recombinase XerD|nr:tyrosine-type recombinase/integrase [archaeon]MBT4647945.1 tyrosine-type recombinase/integrase [archaeon]MBT6820821.1 tyrosine-type recombinase/integrase [archaeon]MBT7393181.1 tyrosine-type recombinase/integrase [archaeon]